MILQAEIQIPSLVNNAVLCRSPEKFYKFDNIMEQMSLRGHSPLHRP